jgi:hypothetical protein
VELRDRIVKEMCRTDCIDTRTITPLLELGLGDTITD